MCIFAKSYRMFLDFIFKRSDIASVIIYFSTLLLEIVNFNTTESKLNELTSRICKNPKTARK